MDTWTSLFLVGSSFGVFLSVIIFTGRSYRNTMLGLTVLSFSLATLYYTAFWTGYSRHINHFFAWFSRLSLLTGPAFYFYINSEKAKLKTILVHLVPVFLAFVHNRIIQYYSKDIIPKISFSWTLIQNVQIVLYAILVLYIFYEQPKSSRTRLKKRLVYFFVGYVLCFVSYYIIYFSGYLIIQIDYAISFLSILFIYYIGIAGFKHPDKLFDRDSLNGKYIKSAITKGYAAEICKKIDAYFQNEKPYLDGGLRISSVSDALNISQHHISQALNMYLNKSFNEYINEKRFEFARKMIEDDSNDMRINEIAFNSGFNNKTTFNSVFKKYLGKTPKTYRQEIKELDN